PANRFEQSHRPKSGDVARVFRHIKAHAHVALRREMVKLIRRKAVNQIQDPLRAGKIAMMQEEPRARLIWILINVVDPLRIKRARPADDSVNFVSFRKKQFGEIRPVLPGNSRDECAFHVRYLPLLFSQPKTHPLSSSSWST